MTAFFNFILSKKTRNKSPKSPQESYNDQGPTTVCETERRGLDRIFSFLHMVTRRKGEGSELMSGESCLNLTERGESIQAMLELRAPPKDADTERRRWKERRPICFRSREEPVEREMEEMEGYCEPDTTSDTAPMITN